MVTWLARCQLKLMHKAVPRRIQTMCCAGSRFDRWTRRLTLQLALPAKLQRSVEAATWSTPLRIVTIVTQILRAIPLGKLTPHITSLEAGYFPPRQAWVPSFIKHVRCRRISRERRMGFSMSRVQPSICFLESYHQDNILTTLLPHHSRGPCRGT